MHDDLENVCASGTVPIPVTLATILAATFYLRGWLHLRLAAANAIPSWRAASFLVGVFLIWLAVGSPLALLDERLLTAHMAQHLLLMTVAPALILIRAPVIPILLALPPHFLPSGFVP